MADLGAIGTLIKPRRAQAFNGLPPSRPRQIVLLTDERLEMYVTVEDDTVTVTAPGVTQVVSWSVPEGSSTLTIGVTYNSEIDASGDRPNVKVRANDAIGVSESTTEAATGGADTIIITETTTGAGIIQAELIVPNSGKDTNVVWTVGGSSGTGVAIGVGNGGGAPVRPTASGSGSRGLSRTAGTSPSRTAGRKV